MAARRRRDNIVVAVLAVLAVLGGGHAIFSIFSSAAPARATDPTIGVIGHAQLASAFAEEFVVAYLGAAAGQQERIGEYVTGQQITLPATGRQVSDPIVVYLARAISSGNLDVWAVTVSVKVGKGTGAISGARQYFRVAVSVADGLRRALSVPAEVEPPGRNADLALAYSGPCSADTPLAQVASGFLTAFLTGNGDVARYTTLDAGISVLRPTPFTGLETASIMADDSSCGTRGTTARVLANVNPKGDGGATATLAYPLTLVRTEGQWQVRSMDPIPALADPLALIVGNDPGRPAPTTAAATATTTAPSSSVRIPPPTQN